MNYTLHQLQVFLKVVEFKSITKAAEALLLTQPAVSIQLKNFQDQFDLPLTEIIGRRLFITDFGLEIAEAARRIIQEVENINYKTQLYKGELSGKLHISVVSTGKYIMPFFLTDFIKKHPHVEVRMDVTNRREVLNSLEQNETDFALVSIPPDKIQVNQIPLLPNKLYLVGPDEYACGTEKMDPFKMEELPLIYREPGSGTRMSMEKFLNKYRINPGKRLELTSNEAVKQAVIAGLGFSIMPRIGLGNQLEKGTLKIIPTRGLPLETHWDLIWLKGKKLGPIAQAYANFLNANKEEIVLKHFQYAE